MPGDGAEVSVPDDGGEVSVPGDGAEVSVPGDGAAPHPPPPAAADRSLHGDPAAASRGGGTRAARGDSESGDKVSVARAWLALLRLLPDGPHLRVGARGARHALAVAARAL